MVKYITLDENAHSKLVKVKKLMREEGIRSPTLSDAVRKLFDEAKLETIGKK